VVFRKRDLAQAKDLFKQTRALHKQLQERFEVLRVQYRAAHPDLVSRESWAKIFEPEKAGSGKAATAKPEKLNQKS
jgi:hypothetical protein